jgi:hypothetical protein
LDFPSARRDKTEFSQMAHEATQMRFLATPAKGEVSGLLMRPGDASICSWSATGPDEHATRYFFGKGFQDTACDFGPLR